MQTNTVGNVGVERQLVIWFQLSFTYARSESNDKQNFNWDSVVKMQILVILIYLEIGRTQNDRLRFRNLIFLFKMSLTK